MNPILEVTSTYGAIVKNFTLGFCVKIFFGSKEKILGQKVDVRTFQGRPIYGGKQNRRGFTEFSDNLSLDFFGTELFVHMPNA